jgi:hypothetical protein
MAESGQAELHAKESVRMYRNLNRLVVNMICIRSGWISLLTTAMLLWAGTESTHASVLMDNTENRSVSIQSMHAALISSTVSRGVHFTMAQADYQLNSIAFAAIDDCASPFLSATKIQWSLYEADATGDPTGGALGFWEMDLNAAASYHTLEISEGPLLLRGRSYLLFAKATRMTRWFTSPTQELPKSDLGITEIRFRDNFSGAWDDSLSTGRGLVQINGTFAGGTPYGGGGSSAVPEPLSATIWSVMTGLVWAIGFHRRARRKHRTTAPLDTSGMAG